MLLSSPVHPPLAQIRDFDDVSLFETLHRLVSPAHAQAEATKYMETVLGHLESPGRNQELVKLADRFIATYTHSRHLDTIAQVFDRSLGSIPLSDVGAERYVHPANREGFEKWCSYGMPPEIYIQHSDFCDWMEESKLLSQMKITRDREFSTVHMQLGEPAIYVTLPGEETRLMGWTELQETFHATQETIQKETFIRHKGTEEVFTYLDNGRGLQKFHPYKALGKEGDKITPITYLNQEEHRRTLDRARDFVREIDPVEATQRAAQNEERTFVLQVVMACTKQPNTNAHKIILEPEHPYLRLICQDDADLKTERGEVLEFGYWPINFPSPLLKVVPGCFRSPDKWNFRPQDKSVVTHIAITPEEAERVIRFTRSYQSNPEEPAGFSTAYQNCAVYIRRALQSIGIDAPTEIDKTAFLAAIAPDWIQAIGRSLSWGYTQTMRAFNIFYHRLPSCIQDPLNRLAEAIKRVLRQIIQWFISICFVPLRVAIGGLQGGTYRALSPEAGLLSDPPDDEEKLSPALRSPRRWFTSFSMPINLTYILRQWQERQPSTDTYPKRNRSQMCIAALRKEEE